jgi:hypothetical protein
MLGLGVFLWVYQLPYALVTIHDTVVSLRVVFVDIHRYKLCIMGGGGWGHAVAQLVEALRYKPDGRRFDS